MILTTERLRLREYRMEDWPVILAYQSETEYLRYYAWSERSEAEVKAFVGRLVESLAEQPRLTFQLAVTLKGSGELIGSCGMRLKTGEARESELGYELAPVQWGRGYATEAAAKMMAFGFEVLGLHRVWAHTVAENLGSQRVMERLGMVREGRLREVEWFKGRWWDEVRYGILDREWRSSTGEA